MFRLVLKNEKKELYDNIIRTMKVIYQVESSTHISRYSKKVTKLIKEANKHKYKADYLSMINERVSIINKTVQAEWFQGTKHFEPEIPFRYELPFIYLKKDIKFY